MPPKQRPAPAVQIVQSKSDPWPRCQGIRTKYACHQPMQHQLWQVTLVSLEVLGSYSPFPNQKNLIWCLQKSFTATWQSLDVSKSQCYRDFCCTSAKELCRDICIVNSFRCRIQQRSNTCPGKIRESLALQFCSGTHKKGVGGANDILFRGVELHEATVLKYIKFV